MCVYVSVCHLRAEAEAAAKAAEAERAAKFVAEVGGGVGVQCNAVQQPQEQAASETATMTQCMECCVSPGPGSVWLACIPALNV